MPPAARITDMHTCPMFTGPVPHVGGPILPPGQPTCLINFLPAATVTSMATCVGPPDVIVKGSAGVFIGFLPAARIGDMTAHGGVIILGSPNVMIGEIGAPSPGAAGVAAIAAGLAMAIDGKGSANASKYAKGGAKSTQATPPVATQALSYKTVSGSEKTSSWVIQWKLSQKAKNGGWIVQHIVVKDASGHERYNFWEAWRVPKGSQYTEYYPDPADDTFRNQSGDVATGDARYYDGLELPPSFTSANPATSAGDLRSTTDDPKLPTTNATEPVHRSRTAP